MPQQHLQNCDIIIWDFFLRGQEQQKMVQDMHTDLKYRCVSLCANNISMSIVIILNANALVYKRNFLFGRGVPLKILMV